MRQEILQKLWTYELEILDEFDAICKKYGLQYYLMWGTLIGAVRHSGFIPWDDDIDVGMPREDYKKFLKIAPSELSERLFLQTPFSDKAHPVYFSKIRMNNTAFYSKGDTNTRKHHGIFIDILPMDSTSRKTTVLSKIKKKLSGVLYNYIFCKRERIETRYKFLCIFPESLLIKLRDRLYEGKGDCYITEGFVFDKSDFEPYKMIEFEGKQYPAPKNYDKVLRSVYGDYMQLPPVEKQVAHNPGRISFDTSLPDEETY